MSISQKKEKTYTIEDMEALPDSERAELIDGQLYDLATPTDGHQAISMFLSGMIWNYIHTNKGYCKVRTAPYAVYLNNDDMNCVQPDISVICSSDKLDSKGCHGAPDWIIEIVSPSSVRMDYAIKLFKYRTAGVREYWIVNKKKDQIFVYNFEHESMNEYTFSDQIRSGIFADLEINFAEIDI